MNHRCRWTAGVFVPGVLVLLVLALPRPLVGQVKAQQAKPAEPAPLVKADTKSLDAQFRALLGTPGDERRIPERLRHRDRAVVQRIASRLRAGASFEDVRGQWVALVRSSRPDDVDALVRWVMRDAYGEQVAAHRRMAERGDDTRGRHRAQQQQQTLQTISNVSKSMHDTAKAIIQNMRG